MPYPRQLMIELSRQCNLQCVGCHHADRPGVINLNTFRHIITAVAKSYDEAMEELPVLCPWFYSEPLMTKDLHEYLIMASAMGYRINLTTNGTISTQWDRLVTRNINYHLLVFSIDGLTPVTYRAIRNADVGQVVEFYRKMRGLMESRDVSIPICIKLTNKGIEWAEVVEFVRYWLADPAIKMVSVSKSFDDTDGPMVTRHECRYLSEFLIIQHDLTIAPCCMRWRAIERGIGKVDIDNPMASWRSHDRMERQRALRDSNPIGYCVGCQSAYTGEMVEGTVDGRPFGKDKPIRTKQDFYNTFYFNGEAV